MGRSRFEALALGAVALVAAANLAAWAVLAQPGAIAVLSAVALLAGSAGWAARRWWRTPPTRLDWDGECWRVATAGRPGAVEVLLDFQAVLLLRWHAPGAPSRWFWPQRGNDPAHWDDVRRAVYSRATPEAPSSESTLAAKP